MRTRYLSVRVEFVLMKKARQRLTFSVAWCQIKSCSSCGRSRKLGKVWQPCCGLKKGDEGKLMLWTLVFALRLEGGKLKDYFVRRQGGGLLLWLELEGEKEDSLTWEEGIGG